MTAKMQRAIQAGRRAAPVNDSAVDLKDIRFSPGTVVAEGEIEVSGSRESHYIVRGELTPQLLHELSGAKTDGGCVVVWGTHELPQIEKYYPSEFGKIEKALGVEEVDSLLSSVDRFPASAHNQLLSLREMLGSAIGPLDDTILDSTRKLDSERVESKFHRYQRIYSEMDRLCIVGLPDPLDIEPSGDREDLITIKKALVDLSGAMPYRGLEELTLNENLDEADRKKFGYVEELKEYFGPNLVAVCAYGSSTYASSFNDFDNFVVVKELEDAYGKLMADKMTFSHDGHSVNLNLLPAKGASKVICAMSSPSVTPSSMKVLHGEFQVMEPDTYDLPALGWSHAYQIAGSRRSGILSKFLPEPEKIVEAVEIGGGLRNDLFEAIVNKPLYFVLRAGLHEIGDGPISKARCNARLAHHDMDRFEYTSNIESIREALTKSVAHTSKLLEIYKPPRP